MTLQGQVKDPQLVRWDLYVVRIFASSANISQDVIYGSLLPGSGSNGLPCFSMHVMYHQIFGMVPTECCK